MFTFFWSRKRLQEAIHEVKERINIEESLKKLSADPEIRIRCENYLILLNDQLFVLEHKLSKKK